MSNLRKDNYVKGTTPHGDLYGKVLRVQGDGVFLATAGGNPVHVKKHQATKITFAEFKAAAGITEQTLENIETLTYVKPQAETAEAPKAVVRPGKKGTGKKAEALEVFASLTDGDKIPTRKEFTDAMAAHGLSAKGASTYFYNIKSGKWTR